MDASEKYVNMCESARLFNANGISKSKITSLILTMEKLGYGSGIHQKK